MTTDINVLQYISESLRQIGDHIASKYPEREWMYKAQNAYWGRAYEAKDSGMPVIWHNLGVTPELLNAMGAMPICVESLASTLGSLRNGIGKYVDMAQRYVPEHICSFNKIAIGLAICGDIPKPDAVIYTSTPCDSSRIGYPLLAEYLGVPHFCVDTPFEVNERGYEYIAGELREAILFLEKVIGQQLDWDLLRKAIEISNQAYALIGQIAELRKLVPCPLPSRLLVMNGIFGSMIGSIELVEFLQTEYEMGKAKAEKGKGHLPHEKIRIAWIQNPISFDLGILDWMESTFGAMVTMDAFGFRRVVPIEDTSSEEQMLRGLGERSLKIPMVHGSAGPIEYWMESVTEICGEYTCNAAIFAGHVGCKHTWAVGKLIKDMISDKYGIPTLVFDVDALDPRYTQPETIRERIKYFLETVQ